MLKASSQEQNVSKGSRQISIVTLGKYMALAIGQMNSMLEKQDL